MRAIDRDVVANRAPGALLQMCSRLLARVMQTLKKRVRAIEAVPVREPR